MDQDGTSLCCQERVTAEQVNLLRNVHTQFPERVVISPIVTAAMWGQVPCASLVLWAPTSVASLVERLWFVEAYFLSPRQPGEARCVGLQFALRTAVGGMPIGFAGFWLFSAVALPHRVFLFAYVFVTPVGATLLCGLFPPVFYSLLPWVMLPLAIRVLMTVTRLAYWGAVSVTICLIVLLQSGRDCAHAVRRSLENLDLMNELAQEKNEAERANQAKSHFLAAAKRDFRQLLKSLSPRPAIVDRRLAEAAASGFVLLHKPVRPAQMQAWMLELPYQATETG